MSALKSPTWREAGHCDRPGCTDEVTMASTSVHCTVVSVIAVESRDLEVSNHKTAVFCEPRKQGMLYEFSFCAA